MMIATMSRGVIVVCVGCGSGGGATIPPDGICPAKAETDKTHIRVRVKTKRFIVFPFGMQHLLHGKRIEQLCKVLAR
jgi:hypothetical protein